MVYGSIDIMSLLSTGREHPLYLTVVSKDKAREYPHVEMPAHYISTIREESRLAYAVLAKVLQDRFNVVYCADTIYVTSYGKPYNSDNQYYFSLSHSNDFIACAVGQCEVGVDIEQPKKIHEKLHPKIMTKSEIAEQADPLSTWIIKEAYSKLQGLGLYLPFSEKTVVAMQNEYPHTIQNTAHYICALFYIDKNAAISIEMTA